MQLIIKNVTKKIRRKTILHQMNLRLSPGIYGLLGPNGAGKTTLFRCITGLYEITDGVIGFIDEVDGIVRLKAEDIGYLPQKFGIFKNMSVQDFMEYFATMKRIDKTEIAKEVKRCLEMVNLEERAKDRVKTLSGGMVRRLGIAQAILGDPKVILLDEPTTGLDPEERIRFKKIIAKMGQEKIIIISTHIVEDIDAICNKIIIMKKGNDLISGTKEEIIAGMQKSVFEVLDEEMYNKEEQFDIIRLQTKGAQVWSRILTDKEINGVKVEATLEDAYYEYMKREENEEGKNKRKEK